MSQSEGPRTPPSRSESPGPAGSGLGAASPTSAPSEAGPASDVVLIHGPTDDQQGLRVLRAREHGIEIGEVRPIQEGKPLTGEIVKLRPRPGSPRICDVETQLSREELDRARGAPPARLGHAGPARVATDAYRANWDAIYRSANGSRGSGELN
jgi:hypothetical protein